MEDFVPGLHSAQRKEAGVLELAQDPLLLFRQVAQGLADPEANSS